MKSRSRYAGAAVGIIIGLSLVPAPVHAAETPGSVRLRDPRINESSGLVDLGSSWVTTNDSGDSSRVFVVSPLSGRTVGISHFHAEVVDVEALAPAGAGAVWVGDLGDNDGDRTSVSVYRVKVGPGRIDVTAPRYRLTYPKGHPDAESLFTDSQGRLHVVTKSFGGGVVYRAPARLSTAHANRLVAVARVAEFATDAALTRDGSHVIVRGPALAGVYTLPGFQRVASFVLPLQPQGEGISVGPTGLVRVSSEGAHTAIRQVSVPASVTAKLDPRAAPAPTPSATPSPTPSPVASTPSPGSSSGAFGPIDPPWLMWGISAVVGIGAIGIGFGLRRRNE